jgi:hypothetical protein
MAQVAALIELEVIAPQEAVLYMVQAAKLEVSSF